MIFFAVAASVFFGSAFGLGMWLMAEAFDRKTKPEYIYPFVLVSIVLGFIFLALYFTQILN